MRAVLAVLCHPLVFTLMCRAPLSFGRVLLARRSSQNRTRNNILMALGVSAGRASCRPQLYLSSVQFSFPPPCAMRRVQ